MQILMYTAQDVLLSSPWMEKSALKNCYQIIQTWIILTKVDMAGLFNRSHIDKYMVLQIIGTSC